MCASVVSINVASLQANQAVTTSQTIRSQITGIQGSEAALTSQVFAAQTRKNTVFNQINLTYSQILEHQNLENSSFTAANNMANTLANFNALSAGIILICFKNCL